MNRLYNLLLVIVFAVLSFSFIAASVDRGWYFFWWIGAYWNSINLVAMMCAYMYQSNSKKTINNGSKDGIYRQNIHELPG